MGKSQRSPKPSSWILGVLPLREGTGRGEKDREKGGGNRGRKREGRKRGKGKRGEGKRAPLSDISGYATA